MKFFKLPAATVVALSIMSSWGSAAFAAIVVSPPDLNPGQQYRLVFVTSQTRDAVPTDIAAYNTFVTGLANSQPLLAALGTTWTAIASTATVDARDNTGTNPHFVLGVPTTLGAPIYRLDGLRVADDNFDLWNGNYPQHAIAVSELGGLTPISNQTTSVPRPWVWTGTGTDGVKSVFGSHLGGGGPLIVAALASDTFFFHPNEWIGLAGSIITDQHAFYAISGDLTVSSVPLPAAVWLLGSALGGLGFVRRRTT
jgi:hypothetical protein